MFGHGPDIEKRTAQMAFPVATLLIALDVGGAVLLALALAPQAAGSGGAFTLDAEALSAFYMILLTGMCGTFSFTCREKERYIFILYYI